MNEYNVKMSDTLLAPGALRRMSCLVASPLLALVLAGCDRAGASDPESKAARHYPTDTWSAAYRTDKHVKFPARACILKDTALSSAGPLDYSNVVREGSVSRLAMAGPREQADVPSVASALLAASCDVFVGTKQETDEVVRSAEHLGATMVTVNDILSKDSARRLVDAAYDKDDAERRMMAQSQSHREREQRSHEVCARDTACVRAAAEVMGTYACMASFVASRRLPDQARDYTAQMVDTVRTFQAMQIAQADWFAIQNLGKANALVASKELVGESEPSEQTISGVCYAAVLADPQFDTLVVRATL